VADPGFELGGGGVDWDMLKVEVKVILACFGHTNITIMLKNNRERSERRMI